MVGVHQRHHWANETRGFECVGRARLIDRQWARDASQHASPASRSVT